MIKETLDTAELNTHLVKLRQDSLLTVRLNFYVRLKLDISELRSAVSKPSGVTEVKPTIWPSTDIPLNLATSAGALTGDTEQTHGPLHVSL